MKIAAALALVATGGEAMQRPAAGSVGAAVRTTATSAADWEAQLREVSLPAGFRAVTTSLEFAPREAPSMAAKMNMSALVCERPATWAGVFTSNALAGAPVVTCRRALADESSEVRGIVVNNKISNVRPSSGAGEADAREVCAACEAALGLPSESLLPASTGVIGWSLPTDEMREATTRFAEASAYDVAAAMMTTDRYPKVAAAALASGGSIVGVAKGAGMIEPELHATMLCFFLTDVAAPRDELQAALAEVCDRSLSSVGVDGDESTSDIALLLSSATRSGFERDDFRRALGDVAAELAHHLVRNGEGTNHVVRLALVSELPPEIEKALARDVLNGPLFKCAVAGNDPNVGRLIARLGQALSRLRRTRPDLLRPDLLRDAVVSIGDDVIFRDGDFQLDPDKDARIRQHFLDAQLGPSDIGLPGKSAGLRYPPHGRCVEIRVDLLPPDAAPRPEPTVVLGSDLTHQYVTENADYRS